MLSPYGCFLYLRQCNAVTALVHAHVTCPVGKVLHVIILTITLREEHKLRVFENRVLRRIFGPKRDGVKGGWRKLHNEELHNL
jgi:hypothetical protein